VKNPIPFAKILFNGQSNKFQELMTINHLDDQMIESEEIEKVN